MIQIDDGWQELNRATRWYSRENYRKRPNNKQGPNGLPRLFGNGTVGCLVPDPIKFPDGMQAFGAILKQRGFQFGLYTSGTNFACDAQSNFKALYASTQYADLRKYDAICFRKWGVDLLKVDSCLPSSTSDSYNQGVMEFWRGALDNNVILYNSRFGCMAKTKCLNTYTCPMQTQRGPNSVVRLYCTRNCDLARTGPDIKPKWASILGSLSTVFGRSKVSKPGFWSDPDYLLPHASLMHFVERRSQFSLWCVVSAPLVISVELTTMDNQTVAMLSNPMAIQVNQKYEGDAGDLRVKTGKLWELIKRFTLQTAVVVVNIGKSLNQFTPTAPALMWRPTLAVYRTNAVICDYVNVWTNAKGTLTAASSFPITERDCLFLVVSNCLTAGEIAQPTNKPSPPTNRLTNKPSTKTASTPAPTARPISPTKRPTLLPTKKPNSASPTRKPATTPTKKNTLVPTKRTLSPTSKGTWPW
ncbi:hypothetical protein BASA81_015061 [Batrachochytrium salamandrivorans]|nr:hypothetical protein BASA81_015061 [Batrachochytrium salamandrivorans]